MKHSLTYAAIAALVITTTPYSYAQLSPGQQRVCDRLKDKEMKPAYCPEETAETKTEDTNTDNNKDDSETRDNDMLYPGNNSAIATLLRLVEFDLANPTKNAQLRNDEVFRSNDPSVWMQIYKIDTGPRIKLIGRAFDQPADIDRLRMNYKTDETAFETALSTLTELYGAPNPRRKDAKVWRVTNPDGGPSQSDRMKIIADMNDQNKYSILVDRRAGGRGNADQSVLTASAAKPARPAPPEPVRSAVSD